MSFDISAEIDTGGPEPHYLEIHFDDTHPAFESDGMAGTAVLTARGYARCGNYTSNLSGMWTRCLTAVMDDHGAAGWCGDDQRRFNSEYTGPEKYKHDPDTERLHLADLAGKRMGDIAPVLHAAVEWGVEHVAELRELNPENGWGNAEGAITFLWDIARFCDQYPN